ncbi:hypothetical protein BCR44DRAFT_1051001 [Catenaria anguillulae PL171]|uniref:RING-type E3 ubiquitin transferase n=1 Tax=Catenaria anguillulae PL171 TaxID=765915 RepID=A0A1Y2HR73_9FUNG|nr:hypothetical protein BCR44DRAFT_1051001 [Catenaria anguillulae PL171]
MSLTFRTIRFRLTLHLQHLMRFSWPSLAIQLVIDCYYAFMFLLSALAQDELMLTYLTAAFVELMHTMFFSWRFLAHVLQSQNSRLASIRIRPVWFLPFYVIVFGFNMLQILLYDPAPFPPLFGLPLLLAFSYPSLQIARSAYMSVTPRTSLVLSVLATGTRLFFPAYLVLCPFNLYTFGHTGKPYIPWLHIIMVWIAVQYAVMATQRLPFLGASWFVPRKWRLVSYDYR